MPRLRRSVSYGHIPQLLRRTGLPGGGQNRKKLNGGATWGESGTNLTTAAQPGPRGNLGFSGRQPAGHVRPERDVFEHTEVVNGYKTMTITIDQDIELLGGVQAGMTSRGFDSVWLCDEQLRVQHFHKHLQALLAG